MPVGERETLVAGSTLSTSDGTPTPFKVNKFRGLICWGIFGAFLIFFIIMTAVYTRPKEYEAANPGDYLSGEDSRLYKGLGSIPSDPDQKETSIMSAIAYYQLGVQLMNLFWYDLAIDKFKQAQQLDPKMAIAYWGQAMCYKRPLWHYEDLDSAQAVFVNLTKNVNPANYTDREQRYIAAAQVYLSPNMTLQERETQYTALMETVWTEDPDDPDACALLGLSILGQLYSVGDYLTDFQRGDLSGRVEDLLNGCASNFARHAGILHYLVVYYDVNDLTQAALGKQPAMQLSDAAPASNVAQHMGSHIFLRFGNWSQVTTANQAALAASDLYCGNAKQDITCDAANRYHALEWQLFGEVQQCAFTTARGNSYKRMQTVASAMNYTGDYGPWLYRTYAHLQLNSLNSLGAIPLHNATDNATSMLPPPLYNATAIQDAADISDHFWPPHAEAHALLARIYSLVANRTAAQQQQPDVQVTVAAALTRLDAIVAMQLNLTASGTAANNTGANMDMAALLQTVRLQAYALVSATACAANNTANCTNWVPLMEQAMALYNTTIGSLTLPTLAIAPTPEFYGNLLLLNTSTAASAAQMFSICLAQLPQRMQCVVGTARAAAAQGDFAKARATYQFLLMQCGTSGDAGFGPLTEARSTMGFVPPPPKPPAKRGALRRSLREVAVAA